MPKIVREGKLESEVEDGGAALIGHVVQDVERENGLFVRIHSWDERVWDHDRKLDSIARVATARVADPDIHAEFSELVGKRVRVTIETLD